MFIARLDDLEHVDVSVKGASQRRGYAFEAFLRDLLASEGLEPRTSYKPAGEQIDGSFFFDARTFLLEAKWEVAAQSASDIYAFKGKVDGKLVGTVGVFVSMSGYSTDAINALTHGKDLNVILFDRADIRRATHDSFSAVLKRKLRAAAEQGLVYFDTSGVQVHRDAGAPGAPSATRDEVASDSPLPSDAPSIIVVCEGRRDEAIVQTIISRLLDAEGRRATVRFLVAGGVDPLPRLVDAARAIAPHAHVVIVAEADMRPNTARELQRQAGQPGTTLVSVRPSLEAWLTTDPALKLDSEDAVRRYGVKHGIRGIECLARILDLARVAESDPAFALLVQTLREHSATP